MGGGGGIKFKAPSLKKFKNTVGVQAMDPVGLSTGDLKDNVEKAYKDTKKAVKKAGSTLTDKNTVLGNAVNSTVSGATGGTIKTSGDGSLQNGNPFTGNTLANGFLTSGAVGTTVVEPYMEGQAQAAKLAKYAQAQANKNQAEVEKQYKARQAQEKALSDASSLLGKRRLNQLRKYKGGGRQGTLKSGANRTTGKSDGEENLGTLSTGKGLLGV